MLNGLDLFSGIGGFGLALKPWVSPIAYCEIDRFCHAVLLQRMRQRQLSRAPIWDDITTLRAAMLPRHGGVDIIYGGFPCQDISVAGHGKGLGGKRSGLYWHIHRLAQELRPTFIFLENVPAIRTRGARELAESLTDLGYDQRWDVISAREVGASFIGDRWFLLAAANGEALRFEQRRREWESWDHTTLDTSIGDTRLTSWSSERGFESRVFGIGNGIPFAMDRDRVLGNAVVPEQARLAFMRLMNLDSIRECK